MQAKEHQPCYGKLFPDSLHAEFNRPAVGKVFSFVVVSPPGLCRAPRHVEMDREAWDACVECPEFDHCYKLSMAKLALDTAVANV